eukprot:Skav211401  [mRNA]  locus=scaffold1528:102492:105500:- [translate_table: standard]
MVALPGPDPPLFGPDWNRVQMNNSVSLVLQRMVWNESSGVGISYPGGVIVRVQGDIPEEAEHYTTVTLLQATVVGTDPLFVCNVPSRSQILLHQTLHADRLKNVVELCSGASMTPIGLKQAGFTHVCSVEMQASLASLHGLVHPQVPMVHASVLDESVVSQIWGHVDQPCTIVVGFACQPYSRGGSQSGGADERARSLPASLQTAHLLQAPVIVLENVMPAKTNSHVQYHIDALQRELGYHVVDCSLKLENMWASNRHRWWVIATHPSLGPVHMPQPAGVSNMVVRDVMPYVKRWPQAEESQLLLSAEEEQRFQLGGQPLRHYLVKPEAKLPTALHSWGGQTQACACSCRKAGFSDELLATKGIYAQLLAVPCEDGPPKFRHLHVQEVAALSGVPLDLTWSSDQRLNLCAIGQMAAPLQSAWVGGCLLRHLDQLFNQANVTDPDTIIASFKNLLWTQVKSMYPDIPRDPPQALDMVDLLLRGEDGTRLVIKVSSKASVEQLLQAEQTLTNVSQVIAIHPATNAVVDLHLRVSDFPELRLCSQVPRAVPVSASPELWTDFPQEDAVMNAAMDTDSDTVEDAIPATEPMHHPVEASAALLMKMTGEQMVALLPPVVADEGLCSVMRDTQMDGQTRSVIHEGQGTAWGDDELWFHMVRCGDSMPGSGVVMIDPLLMTGWALAGSVAQIQQHLNQYTGIHKIFSVVLHKGHWMPYCWTPQGDHLLVRSWDHTLVDINPLNHLHWMICTALGLKTLHVTCERRNFCPDLCGAASMAFMANQLLQRPLPKTDVTLVHLHQELQRQFLTCKRPWCWGFGSDVMDTLANLLQFHGVPNQASMARARLVMQSLGKAEVTRVLEGLNPWKALKGLANQHKPALQLVMPEELQSVVAARQGRDKDKPKSKKARTQPSGPPVMPLALDPAKLELVAGAFRMEDDKEVPQIPPSQVNPLAKGVALMTFHEAKPYLQSNQLLTQQGLALLLLNTPHRMISSAHFSTNASDLLHVAP